MIEKVTAATCVEFAIKTEEIGAELYQGLARKFASDRELRELFEGLGRDEVHHREQIKVMQQRLVPRFRDQPVTAEQQDYLRAMSMSDIFSGPKGLARPTTSEVASAQPATRRRTSPFPKRCSP